MTVVLLTNKNISSNTIVSSSNYNNVWKLVLPERSPEPTPDRSSENHPLINLKEATLVKQSTSPRSFRSSTFLTEATESLPSAAFSVFSKKLFVLHPKEPSSGKLSVSVHELSSLNKLHDHPLPDTLLEKLQASPGNASSSHPSIVSFRAMDTLSSKGASSIVCLFLLESRVVYWNSASMETAVFEGAFSQTDLNPSVPSVFSAFNTRTEALEIFNAKKPTAIFSFEGTSALTKAVWSPREGTKIGILAGRQFSFRDLKSGKEAKLSVQEESVRDFAFLSGEGNKAGADRYIAVLTDKGLRVYTRGLALSKVVKAKKWARQRGETAAFPERLFVEANDSFLVGFSDGSLAKVVLQEGGTDALSSNLGGLVDSGAGSLKPADFPFAQKTGSKEKEADGERRKMEDIERIVGHYKKGTLEPYLFSEYAFSDAVETPKDSAKERNENKVEGEAKPVSEEKDDHDFFNSLGEDKGQASSSPCEGSETVLEKAKWTPNAMEAGNEMPEYSTVPEIALSLLKGAGSLGVIEALLESQVSAKKGKGEKALFEERVVMLLIKAIRSISSKGVTDNGPQKEDPLAKEKDFFRDLLADLLVSFDGASSLHVQPLHLQVCFLMNEWLVGRSDFLFRQVKVTKKNWKDVYGLVQKRASETESLALVGGLSLLDEILGFGVALLFGEGGNGPRPARCVLAALKEVRLSLEKKIGILKVFCSNGQVAPDVPSSTRKLEQTAEKSIGAVNKQTPAVEAKVSKIESLGRATGANDISSLAVEERVEKAEKEENKARESFSNFGACLSVELDKTGLAKADSNKVSLLEQKVNRSLQKAFPDEEVNGLVARLVGCLNERKIAEAERIKGELVKKYWKENKAWLSQLVLIIPILKKYGN